MIDRIPLADSIEDQDIEDLLKEINFRKELPLFNWPNDSPAAKKIYLILQKTMPMPMPAVSYLMVKNYGTRQINGLENKSDYNVLFPLQGQLKFGEKSCDRTGVVLYDEKVIIQSFESLCLMFIIAKTR